MRVRCVFIMSTGNMWCSQLNYEINTHMPVVTRALFSPLSAILDQSTEKLSQQVLCVWNWNYLIFLLFSFFPCPKRIHPQESRRKEGQTRQDSGVGNKNGETSLNGEKNNKLKCRFLALIIT